MRECLRGKGSGQPARGGLHQWRCRRLEEVFLELGLLDVFGEAKTTFIVAEVVNRLLQVISRMTRGSICVLELCDASGAGMSA